MFKISCLLMAVLAGANTAADNEDLLKGLSPEEKKNLLLLQKKNHLNLKLFSAQRKFKIRTEIDAAKISLCVPRTFRNLKTEFFVWLCGFKQTIK